MGPSITHTQSAVGENGFSIKSQIKRWPTSLSRSQVKASEGTRTPDVEMMDNNSFVTQDFVMEGPDKVLAVNLPVPLESSLPAPNEEQDAGVLNVQDYPVQPSTFDKFCPAGFPMSPTIITQDAILADSKDLTVPQLPDSSMNPLLSPMNSAPKAIQTPELTSYQVMQPQQLHEILLPQVVANE
ncbi:hypothetical protein H0H92_009210 [Tricholoma furcatifolium]|nr:hypothetical protein H0H92_009210 [Tricholoma furcatifolium]